MKPILGDEGLYLFSGELAPSGIPFDQLLNGYFDVNNTYVAAAGDVNGDVFQDILVSTKGNGSLSRIDVILGGNVKLTERRPPVATEFDPTFPTMPYGVIAAGKFSVDASTGKKLQGVAVSTSFEVGLFFGGFDFFEDPNKSYTDADAWIQVPVSPVSSVADVGDINNDGFTDLIIGVSNAYSSASGTGSGNAYVFFGPLEQGDFLDALNDADIILEGSEPAEQLGFCVGSAGDFDGDGVDDILVTAPGSAIVHPGGAVTYTDPAVYVFLTSSSTSSGAADITITASAYIDDSHFGDRAVSIGDINGDGKDDILIGAYNQERSGPSDHPGSAYIVYGRSGPYSGPPDAEIQGVNADEQFGYSIAGGSDINNDGVADFIVGAPQGGTTFGTGKVYLFLSPHPAYDAMSPLSASSAGRKLEGENPSDEFGYSLDMSADVTKDRLPDIAIGAPGTNGGEGAVYVFSGLRATTSPIALEASEASTIFRGGPSDQFGHAVLLTKSLNDDDSNVLADELGELIVADESIYTIYRSDDEGFGPIWFSIFPPSDATSSSGLVRTAGDINGDGIADIMLSDPGYDSQTGRVLIYKGGRNNLLRPGGVENPIIINGKSPGEKFGTSMTAGGNLVDDGLPLLKLDEIVVGAPGFNVGGGQAEGRIYAIQPLSPFDDWDGDGVTTADGDCEPDNPAVYPGATEICDGQDNDCDGLIDNDDPDMIVGTFRGALRYVDADGDGYGTGDIMELCPPVGPGYSGNPSDCDDADPLVTTGIYYYPDTDGDGYGDDAGATLSCTSPGAGYVTTPGDCDDTDPLISPDADEICDGVDNNCNGYIDEADPTLVDTYFEDADGDGYGNPAVGLAQCSPIAGYVDNADDCDDTDENINPLATEICNGMDENCNGISDEGLDAGDGDGWGDACDNCPTVSNPSQINSDGDSYGNDCDNCKTTTNEDQANYVHEVRYKPSPQTYENDMYGDACDNCPTVYNPSQDDTDGDGIGDACEHLAKGVGVTTAPCFLCLPVKSASHASNATSVDILVITPQGDSIGLGVNTIGEWADASDTIDVDGDASPDLLITIPHALDGDYTIEVSVASGVDPQETYNLTLLDNDSNEVVLASDQQVPAPGLPDVYNHTNDVCDCSCHGDPQCDSIPDVFDVVAAVDVAFRGEAPIYDFACPQERTDIDCNDVTDVFDVIGFVDVAFRSMDPATVFCDPCP